jgi:predicted RNase H-like HicB family nuclease
MSNVSREKSFNFGCVIRFTLQCSSSRLSETSGQCASAITIALLHRNTAISSSGFGSARTTPSNEFPDRFAAGESRRYNSVVRTFTAVVERDPQTKLFVGYVPGFAGAHSQGGTLEELRENLREVISMLLEDGEPKLEAEFVGTEAILV